MLVKFTFLIVLLLIQSITLSIGSTNEIVNKSDQANSFDTSSFITKIIKSLEDNAIYENSSLIGWNYRVNYTYGYNDIAYAGYQSGLAGIGDFLLSTYLNGFNESYQLLNQIINLFMTSYRTSSDGSIYWGRISGIKTNGWFGMKYGSAGIIKFLEDVNLHLQINNLPLLITKAVQWLINNRLSSGDWEIEYNGQYITTDYEYGSIGIADSFLYLYQTMHNATYLEIAKSITSNIFDMGHWIDNRYEITWTPQVDGSGLSDTSYTGISNGQAGLLELLINMYRVTNDTSYLHYGDGIVNDLIYRSNDGSWPTGGIGYSTDIPDIDSNGLVGYYVGSAGIAKTLLEYYDIQKNDNILTVVAKAEKYISQYILNNGSVEMGKSVKSYKFTGLSSGSAGVALYYSYLYQRYGKDNYKSLIDLIVSHLFDLFNTYGKIPLREDSLDFGYSFNYFDGIAGIGALLIRLLNLQINLVADNYQSILSNVQISNSNEKNNDNNNIRNILFIIAIPALIIFSVVYSYKKKVK